MNEISINNNLQLSQKRFVEKYFENNGNISKSCEDIGISRGTYYNWIKETEFKEQLNQLEDIKIDYVEEKLFQLIDNGNVTAIIFYLNNKGKRRGYNSELRNDNDIPKLSITLRTESKE